LDLLHTAKIATFLIANFVKVIINVQYVCLLM